jgi:hypothetical protein
MTWDMQVGCGMYTHAIRERRYLYFWHYETRTGTRVQVKEYVGPVDSLRAKTEAVRRCEAYYARAAEELERARIASLAGIRALGHA